MMLLEYCFTIELVVLWRLAKRTSV